MPNIVGQIGSIVGETETGGGGGSWGSITGTLSDQTDLQVALDAKANKAGDTFTGAVEIQSNSANALAVGANGVTNPVLKVDASVASGATGVEIVPNTGSLARINAISSGANCGIVISSKGTGEMTLNSGNVTQFQVGGSNFFQSTSNSMTFSNLTRAFTSNVAVTFNGVGATGVPVSTEVTQMLFNFSQTQAHQTGAVTLQREFRFRPSTHSFTAASTVTDCAGLTIDGAPIAGNNATFTNSSSIYSAGQNVATGTGAVTNSYGLNITANTGATNNYAMRLSGGGVIYPTRVATAAGSVTVTAADYIVIVNKTVGAATTVNLPAGALGQQLIIKDGKGDAATNNITVTPAAGNIDGAATFVINVNYGAITLVYNGTEWSII